MRYTYVISVLQFLQVASEVRRGIHEDGPFQPVLMYCDSCWGGKIEWENRTHPVRIGLQCGLTEMWSQKNRVPLCVPMNDTVKRHLLKSKCILFVKSHVLILRLEFTAM